MNRRSFLVHPILLVASIWIFATILYQLKLSELLISSDETLYICLALILIPCLISVLLISIISQHATGLAGGKVISHGEGFALRNWKLLKNLLVFWAIITIVEIILSGGLPLIWIITGSEKGYADFGIPSLHGVMNAILLISSLVAFRMWLAEKKFKYLAIPIFSVVWGLVVISRHLVLVNILQLFFLFLIYKDEKFSFKFLIKLVIAGLVLVVLFGYVGDARSGRANIIAASQINFEYPDYLPSGFLWVYLYITTPLNNLLNTVENYTNFSQTIYYTLSQLVPSFVRGLIYSADELTKGELVSETFNVSTAYVDAFKDYGLVGIAVYSQIISLVATILWKSARTEENDAICAVMAQCALISIFYNHYLVLPILIQIPLLYIYYKFLGVRIVLFRKDQ